MNLRKARRIFMIIALAGLVYYDWPILMRMLGVSEEKQMVIFETSGPVNLDDCSDEKFTLGWVNDFNVENIARVSMMSPKIRFSLNLNDIEKLTFRRGGIISVGTDCAKDTTGNCSVSSPYLIHVGQCFAKEPVMATAWDWSGTFNKILVVENTAGRLKVDVLKDNKKIASLELAVSNPKDSAVLAQLKPNSIISGKNFFKNDQPYKAYVNGVEMIILSLDLN